MRRALLTATALLVAPGCKKDPAPAPPAPAASASPPASALTAPAAREPAPSSAGVVRRVPVQLAAGEELGYSVASHGERVAVSAFKRRGKTGDARPGSVFVFKVGDGRLEQEAELTVDGSHQLGNAIQMDGSTLIAGALYDAGQRPETGAAYVFSLGPGGWSRGEKLAAADARKDDAFGIGVALAGPTLVVGNSREAGGALYAFERAKSGLTLKQTLPFRHANGPAEVFSASGDVLVAGAPYSGKLPEQGLVVVFRRAAGGFEPVAELVETDAAESQHFGSSVAVSGKTLVATSEKQISIFSERDGAWKESARIVPPLTTGLADAALALSGDRLAVGFHLVEAGRVLLYRRQGDAWNLERTVTAPDGRNEDWFGHTVALSERCLVIGAPLAGERAGAAYVLEL